MSSIHNLIKAFREVEQELANAIAHDWPMAEIRSLDARIGRLGAEVIDHVPISADEWRAKFAFLISIARDGDSKGFELLENLFEEIMQLLVETAPSKPLNN